jgi:signal peptidase
MTTTATRPVAQQRPAKAAKKPKKKGVLHYLGVGLSFGLLSLVLLLAVLVVALPMLTKSTPYTVLTSSMNPSYPAGTLVIVKPEATSQIHIGDVITYQIKSDQPEVITHRVIQIVEPTKPGDTVSFITKGDANSLADPAVKPVQIRGVVWYAVPFIGYINDVINGSSRAAIIPFVAGGLFLYAGYSVASTLIDRRRKTAAAAKKAEHDEIDAELRDLVDSQR